MANVIAPLDAANLAQVIYQVQTGYFTRATVDRFKNDWDLSDPQSKIEGKSGTLWLVKKRTGFGVIAGGRGLRFGDDLLLLFRGTDSKFDWATDGTAGFSWTESSQIVHTGFNKCFGSMKNELAKGLESYKRKVRTVHCVGHSLGGALASLCADWLEDTNFLNQTQTCLYTFGSPRVGCEGFAKSLTHSLGQGDQIFRAFHKTDVVPMVPIWPFLHVPYNGQTYCLNSPGSFPSGEYHRMTNYIKTISKVGAKDWSKLLDAQPPIPESSVEKWLRSDSAYSLTINSMNMLNHALMYVVKKALHGVAIAFQNAIGTGVTFLDHLAMALQKGYELATDASIWVLRLVKRMMIALGMKIAKDISVTAQLVKYLLTALLNEINRTVRNAVSLVFSE